MIWVLGTESEGDWWTAYVLDYPGAEELIEWMEGHETRYPHKPETISLRCPYRQSGDKLVGLHSIQIPNMPAWDTQNGFRTGTLVSALVSVSERLPEKDVEVLVFRPNREVDIGWLVAETSIPDKHPVFSITVNPAVYDATHWAEITRPVD